MSKKRRGERRLTVKRLAQVVSPEQGRQRKGEAKLPYRGEYVLMQWFTVEADEQRIEQWRAGFTEESRARMQEEVARCKRMLQAIVADERALDQVCRYLVLLERDSEYETTYISEHYDGDKRFIDVLADVAHCFLPEDREWLLSLLDLDRSQEDLDLVLGVAGLQAAFQLKPSGFHVQENTFLPPRNTPVVE